jgi:hypothetical protein
MKYHDFHLRGYSVENFGSHIVLDLVYEYPSKDRHESRIEFSGVVCYSFQYTTGAVITNIEEMEVATLVKEEEALLAAFAQQYGLKYWKRDISDYIDTLRKERFRAWRIESAIGFSGFVIGRSVEGSP